eukprot:GEMP01039741.1.p2 GENE.GEMP01039741.1~~GEMP01039741.1.p2  ORF type:complete len:173 (-),score=12.65 GEMP01039741.1:1400-1888(-)
MHVARIYQIAPKRAPLNSLLSVSFASIIRPLPAQLPVSTFLPYGAKEDQERIAILKASVEEARKPRDRASYRVRVKEGDRHCADGTFRCTICGVFKTIEAFYVDPTRKYGYSTACKTCKREEKRYYYGYTLRGTMMKILNNAKDSALKRSKMPSREQAVVLS